MPDPQKIPADIDRETFERAEVMSEGLYPHQVTGIAFLMGRRRSILADDMGLGKTRQSILAMQHVEPEGPYLVVCPATAARDRAGAAGGGLRGGGAGTPAGERACGMGHPQLRYSG